MNKINKIVTVYDACGTETLGEISSISADVINASFIEMVSNTLPEPEDSIRYSNIADSSDLTELLNAPNTATFLATGHISDSSTNPVDAQAENAHVAEVLDAAKDSSTGNSAESEDPKKILSELVHDLTEITDTTSQNRHGEGALPADSQQRLFEKYSECFDTIIEKMVQGHVVHIRNSFKQGAGTVTSSDTFIHDAERPFGTMNPDGRIDFDKDNRVRGMFFCIHRDLKRIERMDVDIARKLVDCFESPFGQRIKMATLDGNNLSLPETWQELLRQVGHFEEGRRPTAYYHAAAPMLTRAILLHPERSMNLVPGNDYNVLGLFHEVKQLGPQQMASLARSIMRDELVDIVRGISPEIKEAIMNLGSCLTNKRVYYNQSCSGYFWNAKNELYWSSAQSSETFSSQLTQEIKKEILTLLCQMFNRKMAIGRAHGLSIQQVISPTSAFYASPSRFATCATAIDNFCINQILSVWDDSRQFPKQSLAMTERGMRAKQLNSEQTETKIQISFIKEGQPTNLIFDAGARRMPSSKTIPVCAWQLSQFIGEAVKDNSNGA